MSFPTKALQQFRQLFARRGSVARTLAADCKRSSWALVDQGVVSFGNFGVNILLARLFAGANHLSNLGDYWTLMELMIFLNGIQAALVIYPLTVRAAAEDADALGRMTTRSLLMTLLGWPMLAMAVIATSFVAHIPLTTGIWAAMALLMWQVQETTRRAMMAHLRFGAAIVGDLLSYVGQVGAVAWLGWSGNLSLATTFQAMAITSALAALVQSMQVRLGATSRKDLVIHIRECIKLGRWVFSGNLTNFIIGPMFAWNMRFWVGDALMGVSYALTNLLRLANPLMFAIASMIVPHAARAHQTEGIGRAKSVLRRFTVLGGLMLAPYLGVLLLFPKFILTLVYGADAHQYLARSIVLQLASAATAVTFGIIVTGAFLNGVQRGKSVLVGQIVDAAGAILIAMPCVAVFGLIGASLGWLLASSVQLAVHLYFVIRIPDTVSHTDHAAPKAEGQSLAA